MLSAVAAADGVLAPVVGIVLANVDWVLTADDGVFSLSFLGV